VISYRSERALRHHRRGLSHWPVPSPGPVRRWCGPPCPRSAPWAAATATSVATLSQRIDGMSITLWTGRPFGHGQSMRHRLGRDQPQERQVRAAVPCRSKVNWPTSPYPFWTSTSSPGGRRSARIGSARRAGHPVMRPVRYADDFVVLIAGSRADAEALWDEVGAVLAPMGLRLSAEKTRVCHVDEGSTSWGGASSVDPGTAEPESGRSTPIRHGRPWPR
jgi:hypothetical protein